MPDEYEYDGDTGRTFINGRWVGRGEPPPEFVPTSKHLHTFQGMPVYDDGEGHAFFSCELPITKRGELIQIGKTYDTDQVDKVTVVGMQLQQRGELYAWHIQGYSDEYGEDEFLVYEFKTLCE